MKRFALTVCASVLTLLLFTAARTGIVNGILQTDLDASGHKILNLDTSNLTIPAGALPPTVVYSTRVISAGNGLTGGGDLSVDRTISLGTPSTLTVFSTNSATGTTHTHAVTSSSNPGAAASILATDASGFLSLARLTLSGYLFVQNATANLYLKDLNTGFQAATTQVITPQSGNAVRNTSFTSGVRGWNISDAGDAEFNNILARGELKASVFKVNEISATAGTFGVFYSAAAVYADFTTPASTSSSFSFQAKNSDAGGMLFGVNDIVRFKTWTGSGISDSWATITARVNNTTYTTYTATLNSGSTSATYRAGSATVDYGPSGTGFLTQSADGTIGSSPNLTMATHAGSPWSAQTTLLRAGNLNGSYGYATDVYGVGIGQYGASEPWLTFDTTNGIRIGNNTTTLGQWDTSGNILIGQTGAGQDNIYLSSGAIQIRNGTTVRGQWDSTGAITIGQPSTGSNLTLDTTNGFRVLNGSTVLGQWDTSGNATFGQVATSKANAYWNNSNQRLEFRGSTNGTSVQSYIDTDGSFITGAGNVSLNASGLTIVSDTSYFGSATSAVTWKNGGSTLGVVTNAYTGASSLTALASRAKASETGAANIETQSSAGTRTAVLTLKKATDNTNWAELRGDNSNTFYGLSLGGSALINAPTHMLEVNGTGYFTSNVAVGSGADSAIATFVVRPATDENFKVKGHLTLADGILINSANNADNANKGMELRASAFLLSAGNVQFNNYGAGTLQTDASGNITAASDATLKHVDGDFTRGLDALQGIHPKLYHWNKESGLDTTEQYAGLIAQDVLANVPEAVFKGKDGKLTVSDRTLIAVLINANNELAARVRKLEGKETAPEDAKAQKEISEKRIKDLDAGLAKRKAMEPKPPEKKKGG